MRLAKEEDSERLTGYSHGGVTPVGLAEGGGDIEWGAPERGGGGGGGKKEGAYAIRRLSHSSIIVSFLDSQTNQRGKLCFFLHSVRGVGEELKEKV